jgi:hypothetical protein
VVFRWTVHEGVILVGVQLHYVNEPHPPLFGEGHLVAAEIDVWVVGLILDSSV